MTKTIETKWERKRRALEALLSELRSPYAKDSGLRVQLTHSLSSKLSFTDIDQLGVLIETRKERPAPIAAPANDLVRLQLGVSRLAQELKEAEGWTEVTS